MMLPHDFKEFLQSLNDHGVEYLLIGGYAVAYHGYVRNTADIDVWIAGSANNVSAVITALHAFGFPADAMTAQALSDPRNIIRMGIAPLRIEVFTAIPGVDFQTCYPQRVEATIDGIRVPIIDLANLKVNKAASGRPKDLADLHNLP
ncbi:MAG: nucleotidyltransferase [Roseiflexaceae bacterium]|nr:nucleotidyltransferase [Roseiflexaceae bacterium]